MAAAKKIVIEMPNKDPKGKVDKFEVDDPKESREPVKNVYVSKAALKALGNPGGVRVTIEAL